MNKKVLLVVMDGIGFSKSGIGDAVAKANTPVLDKLLAECPNTRLNAHGVAVGLPSDDDMGNSPAFLRNSNGRLDLPGPTQEAA